jgi:hypothetical protein
VEGIWVAIIAAAAALLGSATTAVISMRSERQRREIEQLREDARYEREDRAAIEMKVNQERDGDAAVGRDVAEQFFQVREHVQDYHAANDGVFDDFFKGEWDSSRERQLRLKIGLIRDSEARSRLVAVLDALLDFQPLAPFSGVLDTQRFVEDTLALGGEHALAVARGQKPERTHLQQFDVLKLNLGLWDDFLEQQAQVRARRERDRLVKEEEAERLRYRQEEAEFDALMDIKSEIEDELDSD